MEGVNVKFSRLEEDLEDLEVENVTGRIRTRKCSWRPVCLVLAIFCLLLVISYNRRDITYKYATLMDKFNQSDTLQNSVVVDLQKVSSKLNIAWRNLTSLENGHNEMKRAKPWLLDINEAKSNVRDQIAVLKTRHDRVASKLTKMNVTVEAISAKVEDNGKNIRGNKDRVELVSGSTSALEARLENISTLIHERIDSVVNRSRDMSVAHEDHQANIYQMISDLEYKQEVIEEEGEETQLATDLSLQRLQTEIVKLEAALNMTVSHWADLKSGHTEFAKKTLAILSNMMELAQTTTERSQQTLKDLEVTNQQDESSTKSPLKSSNCTKVVKIPSSEITCEASSEFHKRFGCQKAFDGQLSVGKKKNSWASKGEGVGAWIKASFSSKKSVSQLKLLQRHFPGEANKKVEIEFSPGVRQLATLPAKGDTHWNIIKLSRNIGADYVKITIKEVYGKINNGFKEIEIYGCDYNI